MENQTVFNRNIHLLIQRNPLLAEAIEHDCSPDESCYGNPVIARSGLIVSCFKNGQSMFSKYNPEREAETFYIPQNQNSVFIAVSGLGSGYHIQSILQNRKNYTLAIEKNVSSLKTLFFQNDFSALLEDPHFFLTTVDSVDSALVSSYLPQLHGNFIHLHHRAWCTFNAEAETKIVSLIQAGLSKISADYSVQSHFGRIWMRNILQNLQQYPKTKHLEHALPIQKKAAIIAAGPSLDESIHTLINERNSTFIIATDTASHIILNYGITPDAIVSIDGQNISYRHFMMDLPSTETLFVLDLCAHPAATTRAQVNGNPVIFFQSAHPLCSCIDSYISKHNLKPLPLLHTTSGTVTIAAVDFAVQFGFTSIVLYGADFSYKGHKPYARGSYLETSFSINANYINPSETEFVRLMYRTELIPKEKDSFTTPVLQNYSDSLDSYCKMLNHNIHIQKNMANSVENLITGTTETCSNRLFFTEKLYNCFNYADFIVWLTGQISNADFSSDFAILATLLPLAAWCEKHSVYKSGKDSFSVVSDFALQLIKRYSGD